MKEISWYRGEQMMSAMAKIVKIIFGGHWINLVINHKYNAHIGFKLMQDAGIIVLTKVRETCSC